jgi:hypothetical protein
MELKEFVKSVLKDVIDAVEETRQESLRDMHLDSGKEQRTFEFDIAVTVEDATKGTGKAGIKVFQLIEGGGEISKEAKNSSISRIRFGVYVDRWTKKENATQTAELDRLNSSNNLDPYR